MWKEIKNVDFFSLKISYNFEFLKKLTNEFKKSTNSFKSKKKFSSFCFINKQFLNNFSALLLFKIIVLDIFNTVDFSKIKIISRSTDILIKLNFWLCACHTSSIKFRIFYFKILNYLNNRTSIGKNVRDLKVFYNRQSFLLPGSRYVRCIVISLARHRRALQQGEEATVNPVFDRLH